MAARGWEGDDAESSFAGRRGDGGAAYGGRDEKDDQHDGGGERAAVDAQQKPPVATKRKRNQLSESHLLSQEGFKKIYQTFPYQTSSGVAGQEAKALNSLIKMYKQWAYDLYPGLNFEDFVDRTEALGKTQGVQGLMSDLRSKEMRRVLGIPDDDSHLPAEEGPTGQNGDDEGRHEPDPEESGFIVPGGDDEDDYYSEDEAMF